MKNKVYKLLKENLNNFVSGQKISEELGVSRTSIWKYINQIRNEGYEIESVSRKGYRLVSCPDVLTYEEVKKYLETDLIGREIVHFESIDSTNYKAKELASADEKQGTVVISEEQISGRGRLGRKWISPKNKGIWMSIILKPDIKPQDASKVTQIGAAAVWCALNDIGVKSYIKWPNDIVINGKKVCGILTEMSGELNRINYVVIGIGINVNSDIDDIPNEIMDIATSVKIQSGQYISRKQLTAYVINYFERFYNQFINQGNIENCIEICRKASIILGKEVRIISNKKEVKVKAIDITEEGELLVEMKDGKTKKIISGEVSVRGLYGYV